MQTLPDKKNATSVDIQALMQTVREMQITLQALQARRNMGEKTHEAKILPKFSNEEPTFSPKKPSKKPETTMRLNLKQSPKPFPSFFPVSPVTAQQNKENNHMNIASSTLTTPPRKKTPTQTTRSSKTPPSPIYSKIGPACST